MLVSSMIVATIPVTDLDRAKHFYAEALGLKVLWESPASGLAVEAGQSSPSSAVHRARLITRSPTSRWPISRRWLANLRGVKSSSLTMPTARCRPPATSRRSARREGRGSAIRMATSSGYARGLDRTLGQLAESSKRLALPSTAEWRQDHSEHRASAIALEQKLSLMRAHDCLLYERSCGAPRPCGPNIPLQTA